MSDEAKRTPQEMEVDNANRFMNTYEEKPTELDDTVWEGLAQHDMRAMSDNYISNGQLDSVAMAKQFIQDHPDFDERHMDKLVDMAGMVAQEFNVTPFVNKE